MELTRCPPEHIASTRKELAHRLTTIEASLASLQLAAGDIGDARLARAILDGRAALETAAVIAKETPCST